MLLPQPQESPAPSLLPLRTQASGLPVPSSFRTQELGVQSTQLVDVSTETKRSGGSTSWVLSQRITKGVSRSRSREGHSYPLHIRSLGGLWHPAFFPYFLPWEVVHPYVLTEPPSAPHQWRSPNILAQSINSSQLSLVKAPVFAGPEHQGPSQPSSLRNLK